MPTCEAISERIETHCDYVAALAREIQKKLPAHVEYDDLVGFGHLGLTEAAAHFDEARGVNFKTFAYTRIRGAIYDGLAKMTGVPKGQSQSRRLAEDVARQRAMGEICQAGADATPAEADLEALSRAFQQTIRRLGVVCAMSSLSDDTGATEPELDEDPADRAAMTELRGRLAGAIDRLPPDQAAIIRGHYFEGASLTDCAAALGKHKAWISRLHARAIDSLREMLLGESR